MKGWKRLRPGNFPLTNAWKMEKFIKRNNLCKLHYIEVNGKKEVRYDYYPVIEYRRRKHDNSFSIRIRMDGSKYTERFRDMEQPLANMFRTVCTEKIEERGYLTYCFELKPQKQVKIQSYEDIPPVGENEIAFSSDIVWNWKKCPHLLLSGNTGSGKTQLTAYIISCLLEQGVRVIYCDPKNDDDMRAYMQNHSSVVYVTKER